MKLTVGFSTTDMWISGAIRSFTNSKVSHCYVRFHDSFLDMSLVAHADFPGVVIETSEYFDRHNVVVEEFDLYDVRLLPLLRKTLRLLRVKYAFRELFVWSWFLLFKRWVKVAMRNPREAPKRIICADFVMRILECYDLPPEEMNPESLRIWMHQNSERYGWTARASHV